jgi:hypothetical protein
MQKFASYKSCLDYKSSIWCYIEKNISIQWKVFHHEPISVAVKMHRGLSYEQMIKMYKCKILNFDMRSQKLKILTLKDCRKSWNSYQFYIMLHDSCTETIYSGCTHGFFYTFFAKFDKFIFIINCTNWKHHIKISDKSFLGNF